MLVSQFTCAAIIHYFFFYETQFSAFYIYIYMFLTMFGALFKGFTTLKFICRGKKIIRKRQEGSGD